ncbi:MAG: reverse transcriptase domain-containing protein [Hyphomonadaceae bacterium]
MSSQTPPGTERGSEPRKQAFLATMLQHEGHRIETSEQAAAFLDVPLGRMIFMLYRASDTDRYTPFEIPKRSGGMRLIHSPNGLIREAQTKLAPFLFDAYNAHPNAHGFIKERSILSNARIHAGQRHVFNVDLADFFPSINFGRVRGLFMAPPFQLGPAAATVFAQLCTVKNGLPQGAPTSPALSNFIAADLDRRLSRLARENGARYSRYADDITFSCNHATMPPALAAFAQDGEDVRVEVGEALARAIASSGFTVNPTKVRLQTRHTRQTVTGLNVNEKPNVSRLRVRQLRAMLHAWEKFGIEQAAVHHFLQHRGLKRLPNYPARAYRNVVYGQLAFLKMVRGAEDPVFLNHAAKVLKLDPNPSRFLRQMVFGADDFDVFLSHASEDKEDIARPIFEACQKLGLKAFLDEAHIGWGQSFTQKINTALGSARTVLAIVSPTSVTKDWPVTEVNTALSLEVSGQKKVVPLIVGRPDLTHLPLISGKDSMMWNGDAMAVAKRLKAAVSGNAPRRPARQPSAPPITPSSNPQQPNADYWKLATGSSPRPAPEPKRSALGKLVAFLLGRPH